MSYAVQVPYTDTTLIVNCKCGTETILTWVREVIKGWDHEKAVSQNIHARMRPATHLGMVYGKTIFVVRDPVHRFVSCYYDRISNPKWKRYYRPNVTIEQWAKELTNRDYRYSNEHWRPQAAMHSMIHRLDLVAYVDLYHLKPRLDHLLAQVSCPSPPLINDKSADKRYTGKPEAQVNPTILQHLRESYKEDFRIYELAKQTPTP